MNVDSLIQKNSVGDVVVVGVLNDKLLSSAEVSTVVELSTTRIRRRAKQGTFPAGIRVGRVWKWNRSEVEQWLAEHPVDKRVKPKVPAPAKPAKPKKKKPKPTKGGVAELSADTSAESTSVVVPITMPITIPDVIPEAVIAAVMDVQPVGADLVTMEVGGVA